MNDIFRVSSTDGEARIAELPTQHGVIETPFFMSVATRAAMKGAVSVDDLEAIQSPVMLCNTYHLFLKPGADLLKKAGGLHKFTRWNQPILTDSGGFQVFSIQNKKITEEGVWFQSHIDGSRFFLDAETSIQTQHSLGADIIMAFDECPPNKPDYAAIARAVRRTTDWAKRSLTEHFLVFDANKKITERPQIFGIIQGGAYEDLRQRSFKEITALPFDGFALGGLAVGETKEVMYQVLGSMAPQLPADKPRYLMGVGTPTDLLEGIGHGIDMFDCVLPARNARHGVIYTWKGKYHIKNACFREDFSALDPDSTDNILNHRGYTRAYVHHLFKVQEDLGKRLASMQNLHFYHELMREARVQIAAKNFYPWKDSLTKQWQENKIATS